MGSTTRDRTDLREILADPAATVLYAWRNVLIFVWHGDAPVELMRRLKAVLTEHLRQVGTVSVVSIVTTLGELPDDEKRRAYKDIVAVHGASFAAVAIVMEREGFASSAIRGLMTGIVMMVGRQQTLHVSSNVEQAVAWLAPKHALATGEELDASELIGVVREALARARPGPSRAAST